jgi:hypothetical protein
MRVFGSQTKVYKIVLIHIMARVTVLERSPDPGLSCSRKLNHRPHQSRGKRHKTHQFENVRGKVQSPHDQKQYWVASHPLLLVIRYVRCRRPLRRKMLKAYERASIVNQHVNENAL